MSKLFQINEDDLGELERNLPQLAQELMPVLANPQRANRLRVLLRRCQTILSDVRWSYGPPEDIQEVSPDCGDGEEPTAYP